MYPKLLMTPADGGAVVLERVPLASGERNEAWLRDFLLRHPQAVPAAEFDRAYADPVAVCRELSTPAGPIDALFVNRNGALTVVECKLWRNPQARREVIGQILDYAKELARWRYEDLQREVSRSLKRQGNALFDVVAAQYPDTDEASFVDAVGRNLRTGRFLLLVAGDGIREGTENIVQFMQDHSGMRFTFGLVEMAGYSLPDGTLLVQPRILARTVAVERIVIRVADPDERSSALTADDDPDNDSDVAPPIRRRQNPNLIENNRQFWERYVQSLRLDDPSQPLPKRRGVGAIRYDLGNPDVWINAYRYRAEEVIATYIEFRGDIGGRLFAGVEIDRAEIDTILRDASPDGEIEWGETPPDRKWVAMRLHMPGTWGPDEEDRQLAWLTAVGNAFVNAFRPRIRRLLDE